MAKVAIPPAALEAMKQELYPHLFTESDDMAREIARAAFEAMIGAWPGMRMSPYWEHMTHKRHVEMILPLTENPDAEA